MAGGPAEPSEQAADADGVAELPEEALDEVAGGVTYTDPIVIPP